MRIALLDDYQDVALSMANWDGLGEDVVVFNDHLSDESALATRLGGFDVIVAMRERTPFPASLLQQLPDLKLLVTTGMRNASIDVAAANQCGIVVCGTPGEPHATAELTWGLILSLLRQIPTEDAATRNGAWQTGLGTGLAGKTLGLLGLGRLGSQVAKVGLAFQMKVIAWSQNLDEERAAGMGVTRAERNALLEQSDVVSIHLVLSNRTRGLIGEDELRSMKPTACLINTSRGPIVEEAALVSALKGGQIAGAGLDVFDIEPLPADHSLRLLPNTVITPHLGYVTRETYAIFYTSALEAIVAFRDGNPVRVLGP